MSRAARWLPRLIGPAILAYFLLTTDVARVVHNLRTVHWAPVLLSLALYPVFTAIKAWRWRVLMRNLGMEVPSFRSTLRLYMIGLFLGGATPGQSGDFLKAWYLRQRGRPLGAALFSILLDRLLDFLIMAMASLLGAVILLRFFPPERRALIELTVAAAAIAVALLVPGLMARRPREWLMRRAAAVAPAGGRATLERWRTQFTTLELRPGVAAAVLCATIGSAAVSMARLWLLFRALEIAIPIAALISCVALISILQAVPISFSGVGVRDAVLVAVLAAYGYRTDEALALSALFLLLNLENMLLGFLVSLRPPAVVRSAVRGERTAPGAAAHDEA